MDSRGRFVEEIANEIGLICLNDGSGTHVSGTSIDLSLVSSAIAPEFSWEVLPTVLSSDHFHIVVTSHCCPQVTIPRPSSYNYKKANWQQYARDAAWQNLPHTENDRQWKFAVTFMDYFTLQLTEAFRSSYIVDSTQNRGGI